MELSAQVLPHCSQRSAAREQPWVHGVAPWEALSARGGWETASYHGCALGPDPWEVPLHGVVGLVSLSVLPFSYLENWENNNLLHGGS